MITLRDAIEIVLQKGFTRERIIKVFEGNNYWMFDYDFGSTNGLPIPGPRPPAVYKDTGELFFYFPPEHDDFLTAKTYPLPKDI